MVSDVSSPDLVRPLVGYRFHPTDEELVGHYLTRKLLGYENGVGDVHIPVVEVCKSEPWDLPDLVKKESSDLVHHFFSPRDYYKYIGSLRSNRKTLAGFWKPTGKPRNVIDTRTKKIIGTKRSLVFYLTKGCRKPVRTQWIMHEYDIPADSKLAMKRSFLLYKLKAEPDEKINEGEPNHKEPSPFDIGSPNLSVITVDSPYSECVLSQHMASDVEERNLIAMSTYDESGQITLDDSDLGNQCVESDPGYQLARGLENPSLNEITAMSTSSLSMASHPEDQDPDKKNGTPAAKEGVLEPQIATPESENQNLHDWIYMPALAVSSGSEINATEAPRLEVQTFADELRALLEPDDCIISVHELLSPISTEESVFSYWNSGFDASFLGGTKSSN